jgi:HEAT repeat protein
VIPLLKEIALDPSSPGDGRRAVFVLAQSANPQAQLSVIEVAKRAAEPVRVEAVKELGRFANPAISSELLQVYQLGTPRVKREVVTSLGDRADRPALLRIAQSESDATVRNTAIVTLGRAGGREELRALYRRLPTDSRKALLTALVNARDEDELIRIAQSDPDPAMRDAARTNLRLLGTPKAIAFLKNTPR